MVRAGLYKLSSVSMAWVGLATPSQLPLKPLSASTCSHTSTIPYGMSLNTNLMSLFDRRGARADQTNSPPEAPTNSLKPESRECE